MDEQNGSDEKVLKRAQNNLKARLKTVFLKNYQHNIIPGYNLNATPAVDEWTSADVMGLYQEFPLNCDLPKPLLPPARLPRTVMNEDDPALQLLSIKSRINDDVNRMIDYYNKHRKEFGTVHSRIMDWNQDKKVWEAKVPKYIADIAEIIEMDPDPYFKGTYNWYHTGGSLSSFCFKNKNILLFSYMNELVATPLMSMQDYLWKPVFRDSAKCKLDGTLYELRHCLLGDNTCSILGRYKNHCNLYTLLEVKDKLTLYQIHSLRSKTPYVSADINSMNANQYCTLNAERRLRLWDVNKTQHIGSKTILQTTVQDDVWGNVKFQPLDANIIMFLNRCCVHQIDTRVSLEQPVLTLCPKLNMEKCEKLSLDIPCRNSFYVYLGTYHSLLMCDTRTPTQCTQQKWTHQFKSAPLLGCSSNRYDKELIVLSSQIAGESALILNTWSSNETSHSYNLPLNVPSIVETLNQSQIQGTCLNPYLRSRFELSNTGATTISDCNGNAYLFQQNSIGDIFYQCITHEEALDKSSVPNSKSYQALDAWEQALSAQSPSIMPLSISDKYNMEHVYKSFTNNTLRFKYDDDRECIESSWKQSIEKLGSYVDILAPELLAVWEVCEEVPVPITAAPVQKVLNWLESASAKDSLPSQEDTDYTPTPVNTQELISVSQEQDISCVDDSNALQELLLPKIKTKPFKKKTRRL